MEDSKENKLILDVIMGKISKIDFENIFPEKLSKNYLLNKINRSKIKKDSDELEYALLLIPYIQDYNLEYFSNIFRELLEGNWHNQQEVLIDILSNTPDEKNIETFYLVAITNYNDRSWDEGIESLAIKCIWGLRRINTLKSWKKIELLSQSNNSIIRLAAKEHLKNRVNG